MSISRVAYPIVQPGLRIIRRSRWLIRWCFGVRVPPGVQVQFDPTTVLLAKFMSELLHIRFAHSEGGETVRILEMGIGEGALVSLSLGLRMSPRLSDPKSEQRQHPSTGATLHIDGVDCSLARVNSSRQVAAHNEIQVHFWQSDLFAQIPADASYEFIFFNPPYVPTQTGHELQLTQRLEVDGDQMWDGGDDGACVLRAFLDEAKKYLTVGGRVVFGVQELFLPDAIVRHVVSQSGFRVAERFNRGWLPSTVYTVDCKQANGS